MNDMIGVDVTAVRTAAEGANWPLGIVYQDVATGKTYKYVKFDNGTGNVASVAGYFAYYKGTSVGTTVTMDVSDSTAVVAGAFVAVIADLGYGWVQIGGIVTSTVTLVSGAAGNLLTATGLTTQDGNLKVAAAVTDIPGPFCLDATAGAVIVRLACPV